MTIILPEVTRQSVLKRLFTDPKALRLKIALFFRPEIVVTSLPEHELKRTLPVRPRDIHHRFIVPIAELDRATVQSLAYARSVSAHVAAIHVAIDPHDVEILNEKWLRLRQHLTKEEETHPEETLTVILPEFVVAHWWEYLLHNQTALQLKRAFAAIPGLVVTDIPQHLLRKSKA